MERNMYTPRGANREKKMTSRARKIDIKIEVQRERHV